MSFDSATGEFTLTDLKSSFGTFLVKDRKKLDPDTPVKLKPGESFYAGDKANVISVEMIIFLFSRYLSGKLRLPERNNNTDNTGRIT